MNQYWNISRGPIERGRLSRSTFIPGVECPICNSTWSAFRRVPILLPPHCEIFLQNQDNVTSSESVLRICYYLKSEGIKSPLIEDDIAKHYFGYHPGDQLGQIKWLECPDTIEAFDWPHGSDGVIACDRQIIVEELSRMCGVSLIPLIKPQRAIDCLNCIVIDPIMNEFENLSLKTKFVECSGCFAHTQEQDFELTARVNRVRKWLRKELLLPSSLIPSKADGFYTSLSSGYFMTERLFQVFEPLLINSNLVSVVRWQSCLESEIPTNIF